MSSVDEEDLVMWENGNNLVYFFLGTETFAVQQIMLSQKVFSISPHLIRCVNIGDDNGRDGEAMSTNQIHQIVLEVMEKAGGSRSLLFIHGAESLLDDKLKRLNFVYRVTDRHSVNKISNLVVVIFWKNDTSPLNTSSSESLFSQEQNWQ
jgi:hypothetical protein